MSEVSLIAAVAVAVTLALLPGAGIGLLLRLRGILLLAVAGPISIALIAVTAVVASWLGIPFGGWTVAVAVVLGWAAAALVGRRVRPREREPHESWSVGTVVTGLAAAAATAAVAVIAFSGDLASLPSQTYDGVFHLNAVSYILDSGNGSSFDLYRMTHPGPGSVEFYPAAWHDLVALVVLLSGASIPVATAAAWIATSGAVFALGSALFAAEACRSLPRPDLAAPIAAVAASFGAAAPFVLLSWGVLYPTALAYSLIPAGLGLILRLVRVRGHRAGTVALLIVWLAATGLAHPRSLPSVMLIVLPLAAAGVGGAIRRGWVDASTRRRTVGWTLAGVIALVAAVGAFSIAVLVYFDAASRPISDRLNGGPATAHQGFGESLLQALLVAPPSGPGESTLAPTPLFAAVLVIGLAVCCLHRSTRWLVGAFALTALLYALSAGSNGDFAKIATGIWYKDKFRLFAILGTLSPVLVAAGAAMLADRVSRIRGLEPWGTRRFLIVAVAISAVLAGTSWWGPTLTGMHRAIADTVTVTDAKDGRLLDSDELALIRRLPELIPDADEAVVGNPWNGSVLVWAEGARRAVFPHLIGDWDPDRLIVLEKLDQAGSDPEVCAALDRLDAHYLFASEGLLWNGDPQAQAFSVVDRAPEAPGFTEIARSGGSALFRITACDG
ncbi:DUF6541 family protein [Naasia lichenicola]|uniref:Uncharacterized protein n=1 Tax=Naasia lichenicola TaxID=2565933 RepID=A0A4S4FLA2_9MICO|nr:DUF6541 family protein [Naasia lichenicola]THG30844.1 hypothetical protein E6C64_09415 [Naasia lichenicola]